MRMLKNTKGTSMVSYGILTGLIAVLSIAAVASLSDSINNIFDTTENTLSSEMVAVGETTGSSFFSTGSGSQEGTDGGTTPAANPYPNQIAFEFTGTGTIRYHIAAATGTDEMVVDFGDGSPTASIFNTDTYSMMGNNITHTYTTPGPHIMTITGDVTYMAKEYGDSPLTDVISLGDSLVTTRSLFAQEQDINSLPALPTTLTDLTRMFESADLSGVSGYGAWDMSNIERISFIFGAASNVTDDITQWNVSNISDMSSVFQAADFDQDISGWDVSSATNMGQMFFNNQTMTHSFTGWNVSGVTYCGNFNYAAPDITALRPNFPACSP